MGKKSRRIVIFILALMMSFSVMIPTQKTDTASKSNGKTYYYKVYAYKGSKKSSASSVKSIKYMQCTVSSLTNTSSGIKIKWSKVSGATGYQIQYSTSSDFSSDKKTVTVSKAATTSRVIVSLTDGEHICAFSLFKMILIVVV